MLAFSTLDRSLSFEEFSTNASTSNSSGRFASATSLDLTQGGLKPLTNQTTVGRPLHAFDWNNWEDWVQWDIDNVPGILHTVPTTTPSMPFMDQPPMPDYGRISGGQDKIDISPALGLTAMSVDAMDQSNL